MFDHILVPLDGSPLAESVLPHVVAVARAYDARVTLMRVLEQIHTTNRLQANDLLGWYISKSEAQAYLDRLTDRLQEAGLSTENTLREGPAAERIIEFAHDHNVNLIILSSHGQSGLSGWNISSIAQKIVLRAYVPVMIVRAYQPVTSSLISLRYRRLLIPLDGSQRAECVLPMATTLARFHGSQFLLAHVVRELEVPHRVSLTREKVELVNRLTEHNRLGAARYLEQLQSRLPLDVQTRLLASDSVMATLHELVALEDVDLVVLSAHGYSCKTKWPYGSVTASFIDHGTTPLLVVQDLSAGEIERTQAEVITREHKGH